MKLFEAIVNANKESLSPINSVSLNTASFRDSLPVVVLTCIDPRLNKMFPNVLGLSDDEFIWLRNAGNIITGPFSSTTRSIALACAIKQGKEVAVIGHTDCLVGKSTVLSITEQFRALGIDRSKLPDNIVEFFGLFASERQNVIKATQFIRQSPLIGPKVPVHGLLIDTNTGRLDWVVRGYETLGTQQTDFATKLEAAAMKVEATADMIQDFHVGKTSLSETKIGETIEKVAKIAHEAKEIVQEHPEVKSPQELIGRVATEYASYIIKEKIYKVIGSDNRVYGPVPGAKIIEWLTEGRISESTPIQMEGTTEWKPIAHLRKSESNFPLRSNVSETVRRLKKHF